jgi:4-amino-4-deoxychorismate lyase
VTKPQLVIIDPPTPMPESDRPAADRLRIVDSDQPAIRAADLGVTRGDGIFESFGVVDGDVQAMQPHLQRLQRSAAMLDLPELDLEVIELGVRKAAELYGPGPNLLVKLVITRGVEGTGVPTGFAYAFEGEDYSRRQQHGTKIISLDRGYRSDVAKTSPWLLQGAKTLSYAVNMAALREAKKRGAEDVLFVSSDGFVLEAPRSTLVCRFGDTFATPTTEFGILEGTTQHAVWEILSDLGYSCEERAIRREELDRADALWLVSSGQQITPVVDLDGKTYDKDSGLSETILKRLLARTQ